MHPKLEDSLLVYTVRSAKLIIVEAQSHELLLCDKGQLTTKVRNLGRIELQDYLEESCTISLTFVKLLLAESDSCNEDVRSLNNLLDVAHRLH